MTANSATDRIPAGPQVEIPAHSQPQAVLPPWWRSSAEQFENLVTKRYRIHRHEKVASRKALSVLGGSLAAAVSIYSVDAVGAVSLPTGSGFLAFCFAIGLPAIAAWLLDRRLLQQLADIDLRSQLWLDLVDAVKYGHIDVPQLQYASTRESEIELYLRKEAALAAKFLASRRTLAPHLPIFGHCFTLENE